MRLNSDDTFGGGAASRDVLVKERVEARIGGMPIEESFDGAGSRVLADVRLDGEPSSSKHSSCDEDV